MYNRKKFLFSLCVTAIFSGLGFVFEAYLRIPFPSLEISLAFAAILLCGMLSGPVWCAVCAFLIDFFATTLAGSGLYFIGFAPGVVLTGVLFGLIGVANKRCQSDFKFGLITVALAVANAVVCELIIKSFAICLFNVVVVGKWSAITWAHFVVIAGIRIGYVALQAVVVVLVAILSRKQIIPKINRMTRGLNG